MQKETIEVFGGGRSATINDFKEAVLYSGDSNKETKKLMAQDKGQTNLVLVLVAV